MQNTVELFRKAPFYTCLHFAHLSLECLLISIELGTTKGARSKIVKKNVTFYNQSKKL